MAVITDHDQSYAARTSSEPTQRTANRVAGRGPYAPAKEGTPIWYNEGTSVAKTINVTGTAEKRRTGR